MYSLLLIGAAAQKIGSEVQALWAEMLKARVVPAPSTYLVVVKFALETAGPGMAPPRPACACAAVRRMLFCLWCCLFAS
jgi:hypothetical protein